MGGLEENSDILGSARSQPNRNLFPLRLATAEGSFGGVVRLAMSNRRGLDKEFPIQGLPRHCNLLERSPSELNSEGFPNQVGL